VSARCCKKNSPSVLSCIGKSIKEGRDRGSEVGIVHNEQDGEGQVPLKKPMESGKRENCKKNSSSGRVSNVPYLCNDKSYRTEYIGEGKCCSDFSKRSESASLLPGSLAWPWTPWKFKSTREERDSERAQIFQKDFGWRNAMRQRRNLFDLRARKHMSDYFGVDLHTYLQLTGKITLKFDIISS